VAAQVVDSLELIARYTGRPEGAEYVIRVRTSNPSRDLVLSLAQDHVELAPATGGGEPDLTVPAEAFGRLVYGRLDPAHTPAFTGDGKLLDVLRRTFPGP
jgi:hypothetical protein